MMGGLRAEEANVGGWRINNAFTLLRSRFRGALVGEDEHGNRYYQERRQTPGARRRRWVVFGQDAEPTTVPPGWVGWLHHRIAAPPSEAPLVTQRWEAERPPNATGTAAAYLPPGAVERGGQRSPATGDYEPWRPD